MKLKNCLLGTSNSISGRHKAFYVNGTKIFMETESYATFYIKTGANGNASNRSVAAYGFGEDNGGPQRTSWKFLFAGEFETILGLMITARAYFQGNATNNGVAGYAAGGLSTSYQRTGASEKISYSTDTFSSIPAITVRGYLTTFSNSGSAAYHAGGYNAGYLTIVQKRSFSNDSLSTITAMSTGRQYPHSISNHGTAGYVMGGQNSSSTRTNSIDKYNFSNDARSTLGATLSDSPYAGQGGALIGVRGYSAGGSNAANNAPTTRTDRITFSNDTRSTLSPNLLAQWYGGSYENG